MATVQNHCNEPCNPDFLRRFMKNHKKADISSKTSPVPMTPTTSKMYGLVVFAALLFGVRTLGSIGAGVAGSEIIKNQLTILQNQKNCHFNPKLTQCFSGDNSHKI